MKVRVVFLLALLLSQPAYASDERIRLINTLVTVSEKDIDQLDNLLNGRNTQPFKQTVDYSRYLTQNLIDSIRHEETRLVNDACQGHYHDGEICGIDYSPITCGQDTPTFTYKIIHSESNRAIITAQHLNYPEIVTYYLVRPNKHWKVDGVNCRGEVKFNVP